MSASSTPVDRPQLPVVARPADVPAKDFAYSYIKDLILDLTLPPGHIVTEMDVATVTGLSRTPVREAFLRLDAERLIQLIPRRGALVTVVTARQIRELSKTRLVLELHAAQEIVANRIEVAETLFPLIEKQETLLAQGVGYPEVVACDRAFHTAIISAVGNTELTELYRSMGDRQQRTGVTSFSAVPGRAEVAAPHHRRIAEALKRFDLAEAEDALREHLERNAPDLERYLP
ncbi:MAG TPA: GntR family transcriptional regulator [Pseudonocardiaceae bacterium]|jgi:DNA-binding GntR family transcriptional regulator|nr:GntR family transcriptional regulator [Pseudonocardiaceae bacterium]